MRHGNATQPKERKTPIEMLLFCDVKSTKEKKIKPWPVKKKTESENQIDIEEQQLLIPTLKFWPQNLNRQLGDIMSSRYAK